MHHVEAPEQVVTPGEELWVKIIDIDLDRRRISLSIKQAAEGGVVAAEYQDQFGEHAYDEQGNYIGPDYTEEEAAAAAEGAAAVEGEVAAVEGEVAAAGEAVAAEGEAATAAEAGEVEAGQVEAAVEATAETEGGEPTAEVRRAAPTGVARCRGEPRR